MTWQSGTGEESAAVDGRGKPAEATFPRLCPGCSETTREPAIDQYGAHKLFECAACGLQFWEPRVMPDAHWYENMYGSRDTKWMALEPGHKYFLADPLVPRGGKLLDIGCGTGNFLAAAHEAGYDVTGIELDRNAARFAKERCGLQNVFPVAITEFVESQEKQQFDVVTFFEVLEHQSAPADFLCKVSTCVAPRGVIAMSVPNRERWLTGPDVLDYPPNHFLRWDAASLKKFLAAHEFEVLSMRQQPAGLAHTAQMINMALRTGISQAAAGEASKSFRDVMQMPPDQAKSVLRTKPNARQRALETLGRVKLWVCALLAVAAYPYVRWRKLKGTYLYCLARKRETGFFEGR